jgi:dihydroorotate dehydrogenase electron transfer subunit
MLYVPGLDEVPLALADVEGDAISVLVKAVGECTRAICELREGSLIGVRGPYGHGFDLQVGRSLLVGGGVGAAPLLFLAKRLAGLGCEIRAVLGAATAEELAVADAFAAHSEVEVSTDDGSAGVMGLASGVAARRILGEEFDCVYACGPEAMLVRLVDNCAKRRVRIQVSLERWIKCGMGICGSCVLDPLGQLVCLDGPVFSGDQLKQATDFGKFFRKTSGSRVAF